MHAIYDKDFDSVGSSSFKLQTNFPSQENVEELQFNEKLSSEIATKNFSAIQMVVSNFVNIALCLYTVVQLLWLL